MLGFDDKAVDLFKMINPIEHSRTKEQSKKYKVEPYVMAADVYGKGNLIGRGGWTWYTGSSSWYFRIGIEQVLGFKIENGYINISPKNIKNWESYSIKYKHGKSVYNIEIKKDNNQPKDQVEITLNGEPSENKIKLNSRGGEYNILVLH